MGQIRTVIGATTIDPKLLTAAERLQYEGYLRREETNAAILALSRSGTPIKQIVRLTGYSWQVVRQAIRGAAGASASVTSDQMAPRAGTPFPPRTTGSTGSPPTCRTAPRRTDCTCV
jgi:hypothetical protein